MFKILFCLSLVLAVTLARTATMYDYRTIIETEKNFLTGKWQMVDTNITPQEQGCVPNGTIEFYSSHDMPYTTFMEADSWHGGNCTKLKLIHDTVLRLPFESGSNWKDGLDGKRVEFGDLFYYFSNFYLLESKNDRKNLNVTVELYLFKDASPISFQKDVPISSLRADVPFFFVAGNWTAYTPATLKEEDKKYQCCVPELLSEVYFFENSTNHLTNMFAESWVGKGCANRVENNIVNLDFAPSSNFNSVKYEFVPRSSSNDIILRFLKPEVKHTDGSLHETIQLYHRGCRVTLIRPSPRAARY